MPPVLVRVVIGLLLIVHGFAHYRLTTAWGARPSAKSSMLSAMGVSGIAIESLGTFLWVASVLTFVVAGFVTLIHPAWWQAPTIAAAALSLVLIVLYGMPVAALGAVVDVATLAALLVLHWPTPSMLGVPS